MKTVTTRNMFTLVLFALGILTGNLQAQTAQDISKVAGQEWLSYGHDYSEARFSTLDQINSSNVNELGLAWTFDTNSFRGLEATPLIHEGILYATRPWSSVFALDARTGELLWNYDPQVDKSLGWKACCDVVNRGVALYESKVYVGAIDGRLIALDAKTGVELWSVQTTDLARPYTITGAPRIADGKVIIGNGGSELGVRGYVTAYDASSGEQAWRFWVVPGNPADGFENDDMKLAATTWSGNWWDIGGGGASWDAIVYDPEAHLVYIGTGNGSPWSHELRSEGVGDNLFLSSIVALNVDNGRVAWYYQTTPGDNWDYTAVQGLIMTDLVFNGVERKVIMQAPKNGFFYVLDRLTGELLSAEPYADVTWASGISKETGRPIETPQARYKDAISTISPGPGGAHNWHPMSYNPLTGLVYLPSQHGSSFNYVVDPDFEYKPGTWNTGIPFGSTQGIPLLPQEEYRPGTGPEPQGPGSLLAWEPLTNKPRWQIDYPIASLGGTLSTAGNLVLHGIGDGHFYAYAADTGAKLWEADLGVGVMAPPVTYELDGIQYISVLAGWGGAPALFGANFTGEYKAEGRVWTFKLGGNKNIEPVHGMALPALTAIDFDASPAIQAQGADLYGERCASCHGRNGASGGALADLRYADAATFAIFQNIVRDGVYAPRGMPKLGAFLDEDEANAIKQYLLAQRKTIMNAQ